MAMTDHSFCRMCLRETLEEVRKYATPEQVKKAWGWRSGPHAAEFHGPDTFYWYGKACCVWSAKASGWGAWLEKRARDERDRVLKVVR